MLRTILVILVLSICAIPAFFVSFFWEIINVLFRRKKLQPSGRTVLLTGGKMTKCLQLARLFYLNGDRVIVAETKLYKWCGTRFSKAVKAFYTIPDVEGSGKVYCQALADIARKERIDLFVPVTSPKASIYEAMAKPFFPSHTKIFHFDLEVVEKLDNKHSFIEMAKGFGLPVPESYLFQNKEELLNHKFNPDKQYLLKKISYDPVYRMDLRKLPHEGWKERVEKLPIDNDNQWVLQEFVQGQEFCTHTTTNKGKVDLYICSKSSSFQVNYAMNQNPAVKEWVTTFVNKLDATGQISFDFIERRDGKILPIECNPRTHSAITLFYNQPEAALAYYGGSEVQMDIVPKTSAKPTYWLYHEVMRLFKSVSLSNSKFLIKRMLRGKEAVFSDQDPWPFWFNNHVSIPYQMIMKMREGVVWKKVDFNIGKIIYSGGD